MKPNRCFSLRCRVALHKLCSLIVAILCIVVSPQAARAQTTPYICTIVGTGYSGFGGDGGKADTAKLHAPAGVALDEATNKLYIADAGNNRIRVVDLTTNIITTYAGQDTAGYSGDTGLADSARLNHPMAVALDSGGNLFIADYNNGVIRRVDASTHIITTIVGDTCSSCTCGSDSTGPATGAYLYQPDGLAIHGNNLYISCLTQGMYVRVVNLLTGEYSNWVGPYSACPGGWAVLCDSILTGLAMNENILRYPVGLATDTAGNLFIANCYNNQIDKIFQSNDSAQVLCNPPTIYPTGVAVDTFGSMYCTSYNGYIYKTYGDSSVIYAGNGVYTRDSGDCGPALNAALHFNNGDGGGDPEGLAVSRDGKRLYIAETNGNRVRLVSPRVSKPITGPHYACIGEYMILHDSVSGGLWTSSDTSVARVSPTTGVVTGIDTGVTTITYSFSSCCYVTYVVTVTTSPTITVTNDGPICACSIVSLNATAHFQSDTVFNYVWTPPGGPPSPGYGTDTVDLDLAWPCTAPSELFTLSVTDSVTGCITNTTSLVSVNPVPVISGTLKVCSGYTTSLTSSVGGGTWLSTNTGAATINSSGFVTAVATVTVTTRDTIKYTLPTGCKTYVILTVNPNPPDISGSSAVCTGSTITLTDDSTGGTWTSGATGIATVNPSGAVTGISSGNATIDYTLSTGCYDSMVVTVNATPTVSGTVNICIGSSTTMSETPALTGTWTSSITSVATVNPATGVVTGISGGTTTIDFTSSSGCTGSFNLTIDSNPPTGTAISGPDTVCVGASILLTGTTPCTTCITGWSSSSTAEATITTTLNLCTVTGVSAGVPIITYTISNACGTDTAMADIAVTVGVLANPGTLTGIEECIGSTTAMTLTGADSGGIWSSGALGIATVSTTGNVTGASGGDATISYSITNGCGTVSATAVATIDAPPTPFSGTAICIGSTTTFSSAGGDTWTSSNTAIATIGSTTGIATGVGLGTTTIDFTNSTTGCVTSAVLTVSTTPDSITGNVPLCVGTTITLGEDVAGGTWTSISTGVATVDGTSDAPDGIITGVSNGTSLVSYAIGSCVATAVVTVEALPTAIGGSSTLCTGQTTTLTETGAGTWSSSNTAFATVDGSGVVTGIATGTVNVTFTSGAGCFTTFPLTINETPAALTGTFSICSGSMTTVSDSTPDGTWSVGAPGSGSATSDGGGVFTGGTSGTTTVTYTGTDGCAVTAVLTVNDVPTIIGPSSLCVGTSSLYNGDGSSGVLTGTFTTSDGGTIASVLGEVITGVAVGTTTITFTSSAGCIGTAPLTVLAVPTIIPTSSFICVGATLPLTVDMTGGTFTDIDGMGWISVGATSGIVTGLTVGGSAIVQYTAPNGCSATITVTVNTTPFVVGPLTVCVGSIITLNPSVAGGSWSTSDGTIAGVDGSGDVTGVGAGVVTIGYTLATGCSATWVVTVIPLPDSITGPSQVCTGSVVTYSDGTTGGIWSETSGFGWPIGASTGIVTGVPTGSPATIAYTDPTTGCSATLVVTVNPTPVVSGPTSVCIGAIITLTATPSGITSWISSATGIATVDGSGDVTGVSAGTVIITCSLGATVATACTATWPVTVNDVPQLVQPIDGPPEICGTATTTYSNPVAGGTWTISPSGTITTTSYGGIVSGLTPGVYTISYTVTDACGSTTLTDVITVNSVPSASISPNFYLYCGASGTPLPITVSASGGTPGYTYSWSPPTFLIPPSADAVTESVSGLTSDQIYTVTVTDKNGCQDTATALVIVPCAEFCQISYSGASCGQIHLLGETSGVLPPGAYAGVFYVDNNLTLSSPGANIDLSVIAIKPGVTIKIAGGATLEMRDTHLFSCSTTQLWNGLQSLTSGGVTGNITMENVLLEDAVTGVSIASPNYTTGVDLIKANHTIFNRCHTGISISGNNSTVNFPTEFGYTVFTSRDFSNYFDGTNTYPCTWPDPQIQLLNTYTSSPEVQMPLNIDNPTGKPTASGAMAYTMIQCKDATDAVNGILLDNVGPYTLSTTGIPPYYGFIFPSDVSTISVGVVPNLFDNMQYGIQAINSNLEVMGATFSYIHPTKTATPPNGVGVYAHETSPYHNFALSVNDPAATVIDNHSNNFYNCNFGVYDANGWNINCNYNQLFSNHMISDGVSTTNGNTGVFINTGKYQAVNVNNNNIYNLVTGISYTDPNENTLAGSHVSLSNNFIQGIPIDYPSGFMQWGITASNPAYGFPTPPVTVINVDKNVINWVINGISANGFVRKTMNISGNTVIMQPEASSLGLTTQYGVHYYNNTNISLTSNFVGGYDPAYRSNINMMGVYATDNTNARSECNNVVNVYQGFSFKGNTNTHHYWDNNRMEYNTRGYWLQGAIGSQGTSTFPSDNLWDGIWTTGEYMTFVNLTTTHPNNSKLYIRFGVTGFDPTLGAYNFSTPLGYAYISSGTPAYDIGFITSSVSAPYLGCYASSALTRTTSDGASGVDSGTSNEQDVYEVAAHSSYGIDSTFDRARSDSSGTSTSEANWIAQMATYRAIISDTALIDSSATLQQFWDFANSGSRYKWLTDIETALAWGDLSTAQSLLSINKDTYLNTSVDTTSGVVMADDSTADGIVENYLSYYGLYLKYIQDSLSSADSATLTALAGLCPETQGAIVYEARALYNVVFLSIGNFEGACGTDTSSSRYAISSQTGGKFDDSKQAYQLYPNPNEGDIVLQQLLLDKNPVNLSLINATGIEVLRREIQFGGYLLPMNLGKFVPGLYMLRLTNSNGHSYNLKFVIKY